MSITLTALMKQRYDTAANWTAQNPTLLAGEFGIESDTKRWKVGTGSTAWTSLLYSNGGTYPLVNADIAAGAEIAVSKLADGSARQLLQTDAAGTGVEWTSDVSIPGVLSIGASSPDGLLTLAGANSNVPRLRIQHPTNDKDAAISTYFDGGGTYLLIGSNHYFNSAASNTKFDATSGSSAWYLDGSGIGIFYNSSGSGSITERFRIRADGTFEVKGGGTAGTSPAFSINPSASANSLVIDSSGNVNIDSNTLYVDAVNNRVGVGTGLPQAELNVAKTGSAATVYIESDAGNNATTSILRFGGASGRSASIQGFRGASSNIQSLDFYTYNTGDAFGMRLTSTGLGIGTNNPGSLLHLADAGNITLGTTTGTKIGTATTQKIGFYNATPVVQPAAVANATTAVDVITQLNDLLAKLRTLGIIAT